MRPRSHPCSIGLAALGAALLLTCKVRADQGGDLERLEPTQITLGQSAQLTISTGQGKPITPPTVPGLDFVAVSQSTQVESINGHTTTKSSVVYQVSAHEVGIFTIPAVTAQALPLTLRVVAGSGGNGSAQGSAQGSTPGATGLPPVAANGLSAGSTRLNADGSAFVRLRLPSHQLYVGESVPVDIQVGLREGLVASLNGLPTLNGDAFTLSKLSSHPEQSEQSVNGKPFTVLTWRAVLVAVKPGTLSLTMTTPLTVRMQTNPPTDADAAGDSIFDDFFKDPFFQNFFGQTTEQEITVASAPEQFDVRALPTSNRPEGFSGAVGNFKVRSELSATTGTAGDPLTLRLHIAGTGTFDRVNTPMLAASSTWKTYQPTASFAPADTAGYRGEKTFEQAVVPTQAGSLTLPRLAFSYFDPQTRRYETAWTSPMSVTVAAAAQGGGAVAAAPAAAPQDAAPVDGLRADHAETGVRVHSLVPLYFRPRYLAIPTGLSLAFLLAALGLWANARVADPARGAARRAARAARAARLAQLTAFAASGDAAAFFNAARLALQQQLAARWQVRPDDITSAMLDARLGAAGKDLGEILALSEQARFSGTAVGRVDLQRHLASIRRCLAQESAS